VIVLPYDKLQGIIRELLASVAVDEKWYLAAYPDVASGLAEGTIGSAKEHYILHGYFEGRLPHDVEVNSDWYLATYPDVATGLGSGGPTAKQHYLEHGYREGRQPVPPADR